MIAENGANQNRMKDVYAIIIIRDKDGSLLKIY